MTTANDASPDRSALVYRHHERLYRLALLTTGDSGAAAALLERAYCELSAASADAETLLLHALLGARPTRGRWRWRADDGDLARSTLERARADALLATLADLAPAERVTIGLAYLGGCSPEEISAELGAPAAGLKPAEVLARWRAVAARALGLVAANADPDMLLRLDRWMDGLLPEEDALALRRAVLEQPDTRALRDGVIATRELLPRAIPALFAVAPPHTLTERLLGIVQGRPSAHRPSVSARRAQALLALGVLAVAIAIIVVPSLFANRAAPSAAQRPSVQQLVDAAIHRFDHAPLQVGVLHEQYRVEYGNGGSYLIERVYDYAAPHRLAITLKPEGTNGQPLFQISSDGRSLVQFRNNPGGSDERRSIDAHVSEAEAQAVLPLLRSQPQAQPFSRGPNDPGDLSPLYLAQARAAGASFLGQTTALGRQAYLLTYRTEQPPQQARRSQQGPAQVVLTIDAQTYALLDVALIAERAAEGSARHPIQAQQFEVLPSVPDARFKLASSRDVMQRTGIASVHIPYIPNDQFLSLEDAVRRAPHALLAPQRLPDTSMRGLAVAADNGRDERDVVLLYEGEFQDVLLLPGRWYSENNEAPSEERSAGEYRYRVLLGFGAGDALTAMVYRADAPEQRLLVILNDEYATSAERETTLQNIIASLTPVDAGSLPALRRNFQPPDVTAGKG
jgi:DNA-directed RNA polymerase specialized sigma24 family protein